VNAGIGTTPGRWLFAVFLITLWCGHLGSYGRQSSHDGAIRLLASGFSTWIAQAQWIHHIENADLAVVAPAKIQLQLNSILQTCPSLPFFRTNAAGILAYDLPAAQQMSDTEAEPLIQAALDLLRQGALTHPSNAAICHLEMGKIILLKRGDPKQAEHYFLLAAGKIKVPDQQH
jgi:hypothetical protein